MTSLGMLIRLVMVCKTSAHFLALQLVEFYRQFSNSKRVLVLQTVTLSKHPHLALLGQVSQLEWVDLFYEDLVSPQRWFVYLQTVFEWCPSNFYFSYQAIRFQFPSREAFRPFTSDLLFGFEF